MSFLALSVNDRNCLWCGYDYAAHRPNLECPNPYELNTYFEYERECEEYRKGKLAGEPCYEKRK